jgi:hypothetical protein
MRRKILGSIDTLISYSFNANFTTILSIDLPSKLFPLGFLTKNLYPFLLSPIRATCPDQFIVLDLVTLTIFCEDYKL